MILYITSAILLCILFSLGRTTLLDCSCQSINGLKCSSLLHIENHLLHISWLQNIHVIAQSSCTHWIYWIEIAALRAAFNWSHAPIEMGASIKDVRPKMAFYYPCPSLSILARPPLKRTSIPAYPPTWGRWLETETMLTKYHLRYSLQLCATVWNSELKWFSKQSLGLKWWLLKGPLCNTSRVKRTSTLARHF